MEDHHRLNECNLGLSGIQTHSLCDMNAALCQLSYQVNWVLVNLSSFQLLHTGLYLEVCV